jgi:hypothetical protein
MQNSYQNISLVPHLDKSFDMASRTPQVNHVNEFLEISNDFTNPLEIIREAISNSFDAKAQNITLTFDVVNIDGEQTFRITIRDDGEGMNSDDLIHFFDLGNSKRRHDRTTIGEKGHGTKVYFNSKHLFIRSKKAGSPPLKAEMHNILAALNRGVVPPYEYDEDPNGLDQGTEITVLSYNQGKLGVFTHNQIKDYIIWKTKFGSVEKEFSILDNKDVKLHFKGLNSQIHETLNFGHVFPPESAPAPKLFDQYNNEAPNYFCKKWEEVGHLPQNPHIEFKAVFYVEGKYVKYSYNDMISRQGKSEPGSYKIQERYGLWLCKDFIPIQLKNDWIVSKGYEFTRFHAFFNCQGFRLTANRGSIDNTPPEIMTDIGNVVKDIYKKITESEEYFLLDWLETEVKEYSSKQKEKNEYTRRQKNALKRNIAYYKGVKLIEPELESGVYALVVILSIVAPDLFPFEVIDYNTNTGIDLLVRERNDLTIEQVRIFYVELKKDLTNRFNHSFEYLHSIICWDTRVKDGDEVYDLGNIKRVMKIANPEKEGDITSYYLEDGRGGRNITVYVLKDFLRQKLGIDFRPTTAK